MRRYGILILPAANKVYTGASVELTRAELAVFGDRLFPGRLTGIDTRRLGGVDYVTFDADELSEEDLNRLANLSSRYALFELRDDLLLPLDAHPEDRFDDDLLTIPKYVGKTNELFTKLLLNVTLLSSDLAAEWGRRKLRVLDPLAGRGTTLSQALTYGFDALGVEADGKHVDAYAAFLRTWLKRKRVKHHAEITRIRRDKKQIGRRLHAEIGVDRESYKAGERLTLDLVHADTLRAAEFFPDRSVDLIVTDAPYGVQHGSRDRTDGLTRSPLELLNAAVPGWCRLLRAGGAVGISWNTYGAGRDEIAAILSDNGLRVCDTPAHHGFRHRVDQAITRDLIVATKA
ncbi:SAM-dependent methyltransferase [Actinoalloteichus sp. AHMU CJ021]|uniref:Methyltransferase domain-containing protein n=1 Tax=Actinoalloteichus caeruleus DSM 43889 TaxID=1120930 RepID=A0ABT1JD45_ACTCY|nr:restriction endonuclease subunit M [Actinoalloteichus caeruleus]AUS80962.1 SAM-dependent methyltransferase [Actinoalloteichus sp. AHMU CJ021]MCP2330411.1 Methyltransferase domain-containing protein [Actinoalloteichus caeruleus DSM 43889]